MTKTIACKLEKITLKVNILGKPQKTSKYSTLGFVWILPNKKWWVKWINLFLFSRLIEFVLTICRNGNICCSVDRKTRPEVSEVDPLNDQLEDI